MSDGKRIYCDCCETVEYLTASTVVSGSRYFPVPAGWAVSEHGSWLCPMCRQSGSTQATSKPSPNLHEEADRG